MKILKIFGIVAGIHVFVFVFIFANQGCSSTAKTVPQPGDTALQPAPPAAVSPARSGIYSSTSDSSALTPANGGFNPDAPAIVAASPAPGVRFSPTRPNSPAAAPLVAEPVVDVTPATTYTVKSGDNLTVIAQRNKITVAHLAAANGISASAVLRPGQKLIVPGRPASPTAAATANGGAGSTKAGNGAAVASSPRSGESLKHTVRSGETLGSIAKQYGVRVGEIAEANNIPDPAKIRLGAELTIPGWTTAGKSAKSKSGGNGGNGAAKSSPPPPATISEPVTTPPPETAPSTLPPVPVIRLDDPAITPAPKN